MAKMKQDLLWEIFLYDDGVLYYREWKTGRKKSLVAGNKDKASGYIKVTLNYKTYLEHRLIWEYHFGSIPDGLEIDHIDGDPSNNKIDNLRAVTKQVNQWNRHTAKGYTWNKSSKKWYAYIYESGKRKHLGQFDNREDAHRAYLDAKKTRNGMEGL